MAKIKTKRERVKFASDNVAGACHEVLDAIIKANDGDSTPYGNDEISTELQDKFSEIFEKEVIRLIFDRFHKGYCHRHLLLKLHLTLQDKHQQHYLKRILHALFLF